MNLFKRLSSMFAGTPTDPGLYFYARCDRCGEVVRVRINPMNDLTVQYGEDGNSNNDTFFIHKVLVGKRCYNRIEADFTFDRNRKLSNKQVTGGKFVERADYEKDQAEHPQAASS